MGFIKHLISYPLTVIYYLVFGATLCVFHPVQWICLQFGYGFHKKSADILCFFLVKGLYVLGVRHRFFNPYALDLKRPHILVANHQSTYDIPPLIWYFRALHPKFISKKELGKGIPSVSFNLRHGGSVLIDRRNSEAALQAIDAFAKKTAQNGHAAVIFPEGTRSRNGVPKRFQRKGLLTLLNQMPEAVVVPISINHSWKTMQNGAFPLGIGFCIDIKAHQPLKVSDFDHTTLINKVEEAVKSGIVTS